MSFFITLPKNQHFADKNRSMTIPLTLSSKTEIVVFGMEEETSGGAIFLYPRETVWIKVED